MLELMRVSRWKKDMDPMLIEELQKCLLTIYNIGVLGYFYTWYSSKNIFWFSYIYTKICVFKRLN